MGLVPLRARGCWEEAVAQAGMCGRGRPLVLLARSAMRLLPLGLETSLALQNDPRWAAFTQALLQAKVQAVSALSPAHRFPGLETEGAGARALVEDLGVCVCLDFH